MVPGGLDHHVSHCGWPPLAFARPEPSAGLRRGPACACRSLVFRGTPGLVVRSVAPHVVEPGQPFTVELRGVGFPFAERASEDQGPRQRVKLVEKGQPCDSKAREWAGARAGRRSGDRWTAG